MNPPTWLGASGNPLPTRPCLTCGREQPVRHIRSEQLRRFEWRVIEWCGHGYDCLPWREADGRWLLVPVIEA